MPTVPIEQVLAETGPILLDFDGPVCGIFAGHPASTIATDLRQRLVGAGVTIPPAITRLQDPLAVLRWTAEQGDDELTRDIEDALSGAELDAVATARPTPSTREVIHSAHEAQRPLAWHRSPPLPRDTGAVRPARPPDRRNSTPSEQALFATAL